ncbi:hypothetical protein OG897_34290 [Streptomyces sp. NBC_00237]|uniref:hypothetical protein n=1 Tax=Streptomyces sp. NBC_00237 TaxID=2975687 RepID=UPI00224CF3D6|nr:hypothetical protein [Streptomyces sp. NBC_00237]MCX5206464.1 hypothetical protein [Streptomyces sp. NBC_00237]
MTMIRELIGLLQEDPSNAWVLALLLFIAAFFLIPLVAPRAQWWKEHLPEVHVNRRRR